MSFSLVSLHPALRAACARRVRCVASCVRHASLHAGASTDVCIVGAGVVGAALACRLASTPQLEGIRITVVEPSAPPALASFDRTSEPDVRVFAITPASQRLLDACGVWASIAGHRCASFTSMQVWDAVGEGTLRFNATDLQRDRLGYIIENRVLQSALYDRLQQHAAAGRVSLVNSSIASIDFPSAVVTPALPPAASTASSSSSDAPATVHMRDGTSLQCSLVVGADGAASQVRSNAHIGTYGWDYDQRGVVATVRTETPHATAWQRFLPHGPIAILPLWDDLSSIVWSTTPAHAAALRAMSRSDFTSAINAVLHAPTAVFRSALARESSAAEPSSSSPSPLHRLYDPRTDAIKFDAGAALQRLGDAIVGRLNAAAGPTDRYTPPPRIVDVLSGAAAFPLRFSQANAYTGPRVALVGDAAHSVHPLAGQGLNLGLGDAAALAASIRAAVEVGDDVGLASTLVEYARSRMAANLALGGGLDAIKRAFASRVDAPHAGPLDGAVLHPWIAARNVGLASINAVPALKAALAKVAMGEV